VLDSRPPPLPCHPHLCSFELSDSRVKGEGELKILSRLLHPTTSSAGSDSNGSSQQRDATHLVIGADSDLLLMALVAGQVQMSRCLAARLHVCSLLCTAKVLQTVGGLVRLCLPMHA
jgi:hypothetical protein